MVSDGVNDLSGLSKMLEKKYRIAYLGSSSVDYTKAKNEAGVISAAIICVSDASKRDYALFKWLETDSMLKAVPLLIYCGSENELKMAKGCLERGAVDIIAPPLIEDIIVNRIENAIRLKDSATFYEIERMLKELPSNIYLKDAEGRYIFATHYWHHLDHSTDPGWTIRGKTDIEIRKDKENAIKAMESDMELLRTGKGTSYVIEINTDGQREFFELIKEPVRDDNGKVTGIIALINDVTEAELLRISLEEKALKDELTGVDNRHSFDKYTVGLESSRRYPISFISADCNDLKLINDTYGHPVGDEYLRIAAFLFKMVLPEESSIFRTGGDEFVMIIPETDEETAMGYVERLREEAQHYRIKDRNVSVAYGISCLDSNEMTIRECLAAADEKMYADKRMYKRSHISHRQ